jgi:lysozyme
MKTSDHGIAIIKQFEGCKLKSYRCPADKLTIGYGHTSDAGSPQVTDGMVITQDEAVRILANDLVKFEKAVDGMVTVELSQGQFDALVSFAYNCGTGALKKSTLLKKVNAEDWDACPAEFMKYTRGGGKVLPGLVRRRKAEVESFVGNDLNEQHFRVTPDAPQASKTMAQSKEGNAAVVAGGAGALAVVSEVLPVVKEGGDILSSLSPNVLVLVVVVGAAIAIWFWRKRRLDEEAA